MSSEPLAEEAAKLLPDKLTREELDDVARFVRFAKRRKAGQRKNIAGLEVVQSA